MDWASTAILSATILGIVNILDSHLISKRMPSLRSFLLPVGICHLTFAIILLFLFPLPEGIGTQPLLAGLASGILRTGAVTIMLYILKKEEVS